jgi:dihydrolipoamide dehydrogenase
MAATPPRVDYDLVVIGSGPGGYVAAIRATQLGLKTACIEKDRPGGVCANVGCIPSKALIHWAEILRGARELAAVGAALDLGRFDYAAVQRKSRLAADRLSKGCEYLLKKNGVELIRGEAALTPDRAVALADGRRLASRNILIATGSRPRAIPGFAFDEDRLLSSTGALMLTALPRRMLILGAGAIGVEFAHVFNAFGVEVHLVEMLDRILPLEDAEVVEILRRSFEKRGIRVATGTKATNWRSGDEGLVVSLEDGRGQGRTVTVDRILVAVGRVPNSENLGLAEAGVETEKGFVTVGDYYQTSVPGIYAVGDVIPAPFLAHLASKEGEIAVEHMAGRRPEPRVDLALNPSAVYAEPSIASFGLTEEKAAAAGRAAAKATFPYRGSGKAVAIDATEGMVKVVYDPATKEILGACAVGVSATECIHELLLAKKSELLPQDIATMIHAHPTISETVMEVMRAVEGWAIHI